MMRRTGLVLGLLVALVMMPTRLMAQSLDELTQQGNTALEAKKYPEAETIWRQVIQLDPKKAVAFSNLCDALYRQNRLDEAMEFCRQAVALDPQLPDAHKNLGNVLLAQKKTDEAIVAFRKVVELDPKDAIVYYNLGIALGRQGKLEEAVVAYRKAIEIAPNKDAKTYNNLGYVLENLGKLEEAIAAYRKAVELDPKYAYAYNNLGNALYGQKKLEEAIAAYQTAIEINPNYSYAYNNLGITLYDRKKLEEAIIAYQKALSLPDDTSGTPTTAHTLAHNNLGLLYQEKGKLEEAIKEFEKATKIDPSSDYARNNLAEAKRKWAIQNGKKVIDPTEKRWLEEENNDPLTPTKRSVVKVIAFFPGSGQGTSIGTGYVIKREGNKTWIITNRHCIFDEKNPAKRGEKLEIEPYYGNPPDNLERGRIKAQVMAQSENDKQVDLTLLEVIGLPQDIQPLPTFLDNVDRGTLITIIGHPGGKNWAIEHGNIMSLEGEDLQLQINVTAGNSGGPVLDNQKRAIGIVRQKGTNPKTETGFAYPMKTIIKKLNQWGITLP
ncbi:MAG: tetratricopeptide repeat protein [Snowella sp.]|nr:tetratricopeptide repeat protein [Snowella sp.]